MAQKDNHPDVPGTKVLFVDIDLSTGYPVVVPFVSVRDLPRALKFLYWPEAASGAPATVAVGSTKLRSHEMVRLAAALSAEHLAGAGEIRDAKVVSWESTGYKIQTPPKIQRFILRALQLK